MKGMTLKAKISIISLFLFIFSISGIALAATNSDVNIIADKTTIDKYKTWTVRFKSSVDLSSLMNAIQVRDLTTGTYVTVSINEGDDDRSLKISPPSDGYQLDHQYQIVIDKTVKSKKGASLKKTATMNFKVSNSSSGSAGGNTGSGDNGGTGGSTGGDSGSVQYTATADVIVSSEIPLFKQVKISSTIPEIKKYKIEDNNNMIDIGTSKFTATDKTTVKVEFYDSNGKLLGSADLNFNESKSNIVLQITPVTQN